MNESTGQRKANRALEEMNQLLLQRDLVGAAHLADLLDQHLDQAAYSSLPPLNATKIHLRREMRQALQRLVQRSEVEIVGERADQRVHEVLLRQHIVAANDLVQQRRQDSLQKEKPWKRTVL